jgi:hypothetical protein
VLPLSARLSSLRALIFGFSLALFRYFSAPRLLVCTGKARLYHSTGGVLQEQPKGEKMLYLADSSRARVAEEAVGNSSGGG